VVDDYKAFCSVLEQAMSAQPAPELKILFYEVNAVRKKYVPRHRHRLDAKHTTVEPIAPQPYHGGKHVKPPVRVWYGNAAETVELVCATDYIVKYKNNRKVGLATAIIHGKRHYKGDFPTTFFIMRMGD